MGDFWGNGVAAQLHFPKNRPLSNDMPVIPYRKIRKLFL
jgi:hypothetical protein